MTLEFSSLAHTHTTDQTAVAALSAHRRAVYEALQDCDGPLTVFELVDGCELDEVNAVIETMVHDGICWREGHMVGLVSEG